MDFAASYLSSNPTGRVMMRLVNIGVLERPVPPYQLATPLLDFIRQNKQMLGDVLLALLPSHGDAEYYMSRDAELLRKHYKDITGSILCLVLEDNPSTFLSSASSVRHVFYDTKDIVYECKSCARGPHRSICKYCFDNTDHSGHDYRSVVVQPPGRCDCGDETTWLGGCSKHSGPNHTTHLDEHVFVANTLVFDLLLSHWKAVLDRFVHGADAAVVNHCNQVTIAFVLLLLPFCFGKTSCIRVLSSQLSSTGLLESLARHERVFKGEAWDLIVELLFTLLGDSNFRIALSKVFFQSCSLPFVDCIAQRTDALLLPDRSYRFYATFIEEIVTVPTVALNLVKEINLLGIMFGHMKDLLSSCASKDGQLQVTEWSALYKSNLTLVQLTRSIMSHVEVVNYATREQLDNFAIWMRVLGYIQGMAPQQRCTGEHVQEEDESRHKTFQFGNYITDIHSLLVDGLCSFSEIVKLSHLTLRAIDKWMVKCVGSAKCEDRAGAFSLLSEESWTQFDYDVSSQEISVQIPLHRLLSLIIVKSFREMIGKTEGSKNFEFFYGEILHGCNQMGFSSFMMEHPLRVKVFCAQVRAGMWRKNGDVAVLNVMQCVHWSELDIFLLQCCAASAPPDLFVTRVVHRFGLLNYLSLNSEDTTEYEPVLVEEMLTLIMHIIKERRFCGFSEEKICKRDLICKLAVGNSKHSELLEDLPTYLFTTFDIEAIIAEVAEYANPRGTNPGSFSLRSNYWKHLDVYHPQWNPQDTQKAEARYMDLWEDTDLALSLPKWLDIMEPLQGISKIATSRSLLEIIRAVIYYSSIKDKPSESRSPYKVIRISLHLLLMGLEISEMKIKSGDEKEDDLPFLALAREEISAGPSVGSDAVKEKTLLSLLVSTMKMYKESTFEAGQSDLSGLIALILEKFAYLSVRCANELQMLSLEVGPHLMLHPSPNSDSRTPSSSSDAEECKLKARARQAATMENMKAAQSKFIESLASEENVDAEIHSHDSEVLTPSVCSICHDPDSKDPISFLVLLQKSRLATFVERVPAVWGNPDKECHPSMIGEITEPRKCLQSGLEATSASTIEHLVQNAINKFSHIGLPVEVEGMVDFIKAQLDCTINVEQPSTSCGASMDALPSIERMEFDIYQSAVKELQNAIDSNQIFPTEHNKEDLTENRDAQCTLLGKYMASLSRERSERSPTSKNYRNEDVSSETSGDLPAYDGFGPIGTDGIHMSSCGHAVHVECRSRYLSSLRERYIDRVAAEGFRSIDPDQGEFPCPLCRRLANSVLPAVANTSSDLGTEFMAASSGAEPNIGSLVTSATNAFRLSLSLILLESASKNIIAESRMHITSLDRNKKMQPALSLILNILSRMYYSGKHKKFLASGRVSHSAVLWDTLKYSLISAEIAARGVRSNMCSGSETSTSGLEVLYRELESSSGFSLSLLLHAVQNTRNENLLQVLLRYRGINLFAASICSGVSVDDEISPVKVNEIGDIASVLKHVDKGVVYWNIYHFWRRAADPVLARDPFSSLMWILFSLPSPFLSSEDCFLCLVHLFYGVSVIQVLITYIGKHQNVIPELGLGDCLISDLFKTVGGTSAKSYFASNHMDGASCHPKDMIRRMSYPYLRRCALLWKLLKSSTPKPFSDRSHETNRVSSNLSDNALESSLNDLSIELKEIEELEQIFEIPDLDVVLKDRTLGTIGLKWFNHFSREFHSLNYGHVLHSTPAVTFRLMRLPRLYQDLLEQYIKQKCPVCGAAQDDPALCLLCGGICSPGLISCSSKSRCQSHAMPCGAGIGVYLLIRRTSILLQRFASHAPWPSPYLDAFGEEDVELKRGKPLYLNEEHYSTLTNMVASHGLDRSSDVFRETTYDGLFVE